MDLSLTILPTTLWSTVGPDADCCLHTLSLEHTPLVLALYVFCRSDVAHTAKHLTAIICQTEQSTKGGASIHGGCVLL